MDKIPHEKRIEIALLHILGLTVAEIEKQTGVSHGSVVNIVKEVETGHLVVPGIPSEQVHDLRQLSITLKKTGFGVSQALLGVNFFARLNELGIQAGEIDKWTEMVKAFAPEDFPAKDFFAAALQMYRLQKETGKPFEVITGQYQAMLQKSGELKNEIKSSLQQKESLTSDVTSLTGDVADLAGKKKTTQADLDNKIIELETANAHLDEVQGKTNQLNAEVYLLEEKKSKLSAEIDAKEQSRIRLNELGFSDEDLLRFRNLAADIAKNGDNSPAAIREEFFSAWGLYADLASFKKAKQAEGEVLQELAKKKAGLLGEIAALENRKTVLNGEVLETGTNAAQQIQAASVEAVTSIREEGATIREEIKSMLGDILVAGKAVGEMMAARKDSVAVGKELEELMNVVQRQLGEG